MVNTATGIFEVTMQPGPAELDGAISRFELSKTFHGDLQGTGAGGSQRCTNPPFPTGRPAGPRADIGHVPSHRYQVAAAAR